MDEQKLAPQEAKPMDHAQNKMIFGILAYLGILVVVPYMVAKDDPFVKFHIKQGLVLLVIELAVIVLASAMWQMWMLLNLVNIAILALSIVGIVNVVQNKQAELPLIGQFAHRIKI